MQSKRDNTQFWKLYKNSMKWISSSNLEQRSQYLKRLCHNPLFNLNNDISACQNDTLEEKQLLKDKEETALDLKQIKFELEQLEDYEELECWSDSNDESDLDVEYLKFREITRAHQIERAKQRAEELERLRLTQYFDLTKTERQQRLLDSTCTSDRKDNLHKMYGPQADRVAQVESRHQFIFNDFCDRKQPCFWPQLPINLSLSNYKLS